MNVGTRLDALERVVGTEPPDRCGNCGAAWVGSTFLCIEEDGRRRWACIKCLADREPPALRPARAYYRWMIEALQA
jgi:hypothetical protein